MGSEMCIRDRRLTSVRRLPFHSPELLSVRQAWSDMDHSSWRGQQEAGPTLALVTALRRAHDATETPVLWPTPQEAREELRRTKRRRGDSRGARGYRRGDGGSGGDGGHGGGSVTVGVATPTTAAEETMEAIEARLVEVVAREPSEFWTR